MLTQALVAATVGALVGGVVGCLATRDWRFLLFYMAAGSLGALFYAFQPMLKGSEYIRMAPKSLAIYAVASSGLAILFTSGRRRR